MNLNAGDKLCSLENKEDLFLLAPVHHREDQNQPDCVWGGNLALILTVFIVSSVFPVWRGIRASSAVGWSQGWGRCLRWEPGSQERSSRIPVFDYPVWLVFCRRGRARLREVCQRGRGAIRLPTDLLSLKLPQLFDIHQVPKVRVRSLSYPAPEKNSWLLLTVWKCHATQAQY